MIASGKQGARALATAAVAVLVVAVAVMMIVPLPTWLLDLLISANLSVAVAVLLAAAYAEGPLSLASFPTVLVLTTLFRLALNVSTVRLILLQADAGEVVRAFGAFVVRGDYVVGFAVFLILTIVQYVVIARGAERVAEVAARFALDAMPGRQLAIEADLRGATIDAGEAGRRREALQREAQLYGSLDGAMRFVKGDAVAGILILVVSLLGGLAIGLLRRDMTLADAARLYTLLTIGDGLASQIPALLLSTAAGLLVTRTAPAEGDAAGAAPGLDVARLLAGRPWLLFGVAGLFGLLAILPGLPVVPFGAIALLFGVGGVVLLQRSNRVGPGAGGGAIGRALLPTPVPAVLVELGRDFAARPDVSRALDEAARRVVEDLGAPLEAPVGAAAADLGARGYRVRLRGETVAEGEIDAGAEGQGPLGRLANAVSRALERRAGELIGPDETQRLLDALGTRAPALVRETVPRRVDLPALAQVLRRLVGEGVPIGDLREILEAIAAQREPERDAVLLAERIRRALARRISARVAPSGTLRCLLLDPLLEEAIRDAVRPAEGAPGGVELALEPELARDLLVSLGEARAAAEAQGNVVLVTAPDVRRHVRRLIEEEQPEVIVVSWPELLAGVEVEPIARVGA